MKNQNRNPIRSSWHRIVLPALLLSYAGQTALLIETPSSVGNPFFKLVSNRHPACYARTVPTIITSQAISPERSR